MTEARPVLIRRADAADAVAITALVADAYGKYIARIGRLPKPMTADQHAAVRDHEVWVAVDAADDTLAGVLELIVSPDSFFIENVAVAPTHQGVGLGRQLLDLAESEARRRGYDAIGLETNEQFVENLAIYARRGYLETGRRLVGDTAVIQLTKRLDEARPSSGGLAARVIVVAAWPSSARAPSAAIGSVAGGFGRQREGLTVQRRPGRPPRRTRRRTRASPSARSRPRAVMSAGHRTASPAATRVRSSPTPTQPPPSMTMNQVVFGLACGSIRASRAKASSLTTPRAVGVDDLAGQPDASRSGRPGAGGRRRTGGSRWARRARRRRVSAGGAAARPPRLRIVASGSANFCVEAYFCFASCVSYAARNGGNRRNRIQTSVPSPMISIARTRKKSNTKTRLDQDQAERDQAGPPDPLPHLEVRRVPVERPRPE